MLGFRTAGGKKTLRLKTTRSKLVLLASRTIKLGWKKKKLALRLLFFYCEPQKDLFDKNLSHPSSISDVKKHRKL